MLSEKCQACGVQFLFEGKFIFVACPYWLIDKREKNIKFSKQLLSAFVLGSVTHVCCDETNDLGTFSPGSGLFHLNIWGTRGRQFKKILWVVVGCKKFNLWWVAVIRKLPLWVVMELEAKFLIKIASIGGYGARG